MQEFISPKAVAAALNISVSGVFLLADRGILPKPFKVAGMTRVSWLKSEIDAISSAMIQGQSPEQIRALAVSLTAKRGES
jgi:predicted DNA-binding transcriptional regulator AlpA